MTLFIINSIISLDDRYQCFLLYLKFLNCRNFPLLTSLSTQNIKNQNISDVKMIVDNDDNDDDIEKVTYIQKNVMPVVQLILWRQQ